MPLFSQPKSRTFWRQKTHTLKNTKVPVREKGASRPLTGPYVHRTVRVAVRPTVLVTGHAVVALRRRTRRSAAVLV